MALPRAAPSGSSATAQGRGWPISLEYTRVRESSPRTSSTGRQPVSRPPAAPHASFQKIEEDELERPVSRHQLVLDAQVHTRLLDLGGVRGEPLEVLVP